MLGSLMCYQGGITVPAYAASKGAIKSLVQALSNEWAKEGVTVNVSGTIGLSMDRR